MALQPSPHIPIHQLQSAIDHFPIPVVSFNPPLFLERRGFVLQIIRTEQFNSVLDIGCGEGELLGTLCEPALTLPDPDPSPSHLLSTDYPSLELSDIHVSRIAGLDICRSDLVEAAIATAPPKTPDGDTSPWSRPRPRWEDLEVQLWKGSLEDFNAEFQEYECIVATEVYTLIEHLPEDILSHFSPMILGVYRPRLLLLTTPSYTFNQLFSHPNTPPEHIRTHGHLDPTGRTDRVFRHSDHKFEFTPDEFRQWCDNAADTYGYTVEISGVGKASEPDPWGRHEAAGWASQTAIFRRIDTFKREVLTPPVGPTHHELFATHLHQRHPSSGKHQHPLSLELAEEIRQRIIHVMRELNDGTVQLFELWNDEVLAAMCGGDVNILTEVLTLEVTKQNGFTTKPGKGRWNAAVLWDRFVKEARPGPWDEKDEVEEWGSDLSDSNDNIESQIEHSEEYVSNDASLWGSPDHSGWGGQWEATESWGSSVDNGWGVATAAST